jgi:hypothetical protein
LEPFELVELEEPPHPLVARASIRPAPSRLTRRAV